MDIEGEAPENFRSLCLLVRLAEGVHKRWVYARFLNGAWQSVFEGGCPVGELIPRRNQMARRNAIIGRILLG